jgi:hypothetical protein
MNACPSNPALTSAIREAARYLDWPPNCAAADEWLYLVLSVHELAHLFMWRRFGVEASLRLECSPAGEICGAVADGDVDPSTLRPFEASCIGWAGVIAEHLTGWILRPCPLVPPLQVENFRRWFRAFRAEAWQSLSEEDRRLIAMGRDTSLSAEFTLHVLAGSSANRELYKRIPETVKLLREAHAKARRQVGNVLGVRTRRFAEGLFDSEGVA